MLEIRQVQEDDAPVVLALDRPSENLLALQQVRKVDVDGRHLVLFERLDLLDVVEARIALSARLRVGRRRWEGNVGCVADRGEAAHRARATPRRGGQEVSLMSRTR